MPPNHTHIIIHFSVIYYQHLNVISKSSKNIYIFTIKLSKIFLKPLLTLWLTDLKNSKTELPDLSNYVQMDEKQPRMQK